MKQDPLLNVFNQLKSLLSKYEPPLTAKSNYQTRYELEFDKELLSEIKGMVKKGYKLYDSFDGYSYNS